MFTILLLTHWWGEFVRIIVHCYLPLCCTSINSSVSFHKICYFKYYLLKLLDFSIASCHFPNVTNMHLSYGSCTVLRTAYSTIMRSLQQYPKSLRPSLGPCNYPIFLSQRFHRPINFSFEFISNSDPHRNLSNQLQSQVQTTVDTSI